MAVSDFTYQYGSDGVNKKRVVGLSLLALAVLGSLGYGFRTYYSNTAQVNRLVNTYYATQNNGDIAKLKTLESKSLREVPYGVLGDNTSKSSSGKDSKDNQKLTIVATKLNKKSGAVGGEIKEAGSTQGTPYIAQVVKEDGKWKISVFNIGLITKDDLK